MGHINQVVVIAVLLMSSGCNTGGTVATQNSPVAEDAGVVLTAEQVTHAGFTTALVEARTASETLRLPGSLEVNPQSSWHVSPVVEGVVEDVGAVTNDVVKRGQTLARLRSTALGEAQIAWLEARANFRLANAERERNLLLKKDGVVSDSQWLRVDTEFQRAQGALGLSERKLTLAGLTSRQIAALELPERRLGEMTLSSPSDGVVLASGASRGQALAAGEEAFNIANLSTLWVTVHIPVSSVVQVKPGAKATVRVVGSPRPGWDGEFGSLSGQVDAARQTVEGRVVVTNDGDFLRPGMYAEVEVVGVPVQALMVPVQAVFSVGNRTYVFQKVGDTRFQPLLVTAGAPVGELIPVSGPEIKAGVTVVVAGLAELKSHWLYNGGQ